LTKFVSVGDAAGGASNRGTLTQTTLGFLLGTDFDYRAALDYTNGLQFGSGTAASDWKMSRTAADEVSLATGDVLRMDTVAVSDNSTRLATTAAVTTALGAYLTTATAASTYAPLASPTFTGTVTASGATAVTVPTVAIGAGSNAATIGAVNTALGAYLTTSSAASTYLPLAGGTMASNASIGFNSTSTGTPLFGSRVNTDTGNRVQIDSDGMWFGSGSGSPDVRIRHISSLTGGTNAIYLTAGNWIRVLQDAVDGNDLVRKAQFDYAHSSDRDQMLNAIEDAIANHRHDDVYETGSRRVGGITDNLTRATSVVKAQSFDPLTMLNATSSSQALTDGTVLFTAVWIPETLLTTGVIVPMATQGAFTADNNNKVGLYSSDGTTLTLVASTANNSGIFTQATGAAAQFAWASTVVLQPGLYYAAYLYNSSAQTTAPSVVGQSLTGALAGIGQSGNLFRAGTLAAQTDLPSTQAISGISKTGGSAQKLLYAAIY
jgi:hypothetical protein